MVRIDVLIPAYNAERTIVESIRSIQRQTFWELDIVVVDDGSTDLTSELLVALSAEDPRVRVITTHNRGIVAALNTALAASANPIVARHDADDIAFPERLQLQLDYLTAHPGCVAVGANAWHIDAAGLRLGSSSNFAGDVQPDPTAIPSREPYLMHPFLCVRRSALSEIGGYRDVFHSEDTDLYWRLFQLGSLHNLKPMLGEYRIHEDSVSSASILNGRIAATYSQLAAVSFRRRLGDKNDLPFAREDLAVLKEKGSLSEIIDFAGRDLEPDEKSYLVVATSAKLLELASYRHYALTVPDCRFIATALRTYAARMDPGDRRRSLRYQADLVRRYAHDRNFAQIAALRPPLFVLAILSKRLLSRHAAGSRRG